MYIKISIMQLVPLATKFKKAGIMQVSWMYNSGIETYSAVVKPFLQ